MQPIEVFSLLVTGSETIYPQISHSFFPKLNLNLETAQKVKKTVKQSGDPEWFALRKLRLTASNYGLVVNRKKQPTEVFLRNIFQPKDLSNVASIKHGKQNESIARTLYAHEMQKRNTKFTVYYAGLVINPSPPYLGASPDGKQSLILLTRNHLVSWR